MPDLPMPNVPQMMSGLMVQITAAMANTSKSLPARIFRRVSGKYT